MLHKNSRVIHTQRKLLDQTRVAFKAILSNAGIQWIRSGKQEIIRLAPEQYILTESLLQLIPRKLIHTISHGDGGIDITFYPSLTRKQQEIVTTQIEPIDGDIVFGQGEHGIITPADSNERVSTFRSCPCRSYLIHNKQRFVAFAHLAASLDIDLVQQLRRELIVQGADPNTLILDASSHVRTDCRELFDKLFPTTRYSLGGSFVYDLRERVLDPVPLKLPSSKNMDLRTALKNDIRWEHGIPSILSYVTRS